MAMSRIANNNDNTELEQLCRTMGRGVLSVAQSYTYKTFITVSFDLIFLYAFVGECVFDLGM